MLKLAQATTELTSVQMGTNSLESSAFNIFMILVPLAFFITLFVFWVIALIGAAGRKDLKENRWLWIVLLIFVGYIGMVIYFFVENRKKLGWASIMIVLAGLLSLLFFIF